MKKILKKTAAVLGYLLLLLASAGCGFFVTITLFSGFFPAHQVILAVLAVLLLYYISIIIHEGGHLVFGLMSGYKFSSFRIGSLMWVRQDGKIKLRRLKIAGTLGQCLMAPPEAKNGKIPVVLYNLGGVIANIIFTALLALLYFLTLRYVVVALVFLVGAMLSFILALANGIPLNAGGVPNDGMNALSLKGNKAAAVAFANQLLMNAAQARGAGLSEMPDEWFILPDDADMQNVICASIAVFAASRTMEEMNFEKAEGEINSLLQSSANITRLHRSLLTCDLIYCRLVLEGKGAEISSLLTIDQQKFMKSMRKFPSVLRTEYAIALIRDKNAEQAEKIKQKFKMQAKKYPYPQDIDLDHSLMEKALERYKSK